jgi:integrase
MALLQKVRIMIRFNRNGKWVMMPAMWSGNKRYLVPARAESMRSDIEGTYTYYLRYTTPEGKRVFEPAGKNSVMVVADANNRDIELIAAERGIKPEESKAETITTRIKTDDAITEYLSRFTNPTRRATFLAYRRALEIFREVCSCTYFDEISEACVRAFVERLGRENDQDTIYHRYHYLEFFLRRHGKDKLLPKSDRPKKRPLDEDGTAIATYEEGGVEKLVAAAGTERDKLAILIPSEGGLRKGEVAHLEKEDIYDGRIIVRAFKQGWKTKTGRGRTVDVPRWLTDRIKLWMATLPERQSFLFVNEDGNPDRHLEDIVNDLAAKAGVKVPVTPTGERQPFHGFRSYFAIKRLREGHDVNTVRRWGGWKDLKIMLRYLAKARGITEDARNLLDGVKNGKAA